MRRPKLYKRFLFSLACTGLVFSGPCGITGTQFREFLTNTLINTAVTTAASFVDAVLIAGDPNGA